VFAAKKYDALSKDELRKEKNSLMQEVLKEKTVTITSETIATFQAKSFSTRMQALSSKREVIELLINALVLSSCNVSFDRIAFRKRSDNRGAK
jgi:hypothetical protein